MNSTIATTMIQKNESSTTASVAGFQHGKQAPSSKKKRLNKASKPYKFEDLIAKNIFDSKFDEVVRKRGALWVLFDDETETHVSAHKTRKDAWEKQRSFRKRRAVEKQVKSREKESKKEREKTMASMASDHSSKRESVDLITTIAKRIDRK